MQGNTAAIRASQLAAITDDVSRAIQQQIFDLQDQQAADQAAQKAAEEAAQAADQLRQAWESVGNSIEDEIKRIRGLSDTSGAQGFASLQAQFNGAIAAAMGGDQDAAKSLPGLSKSLLDVAENVATSEQELRRIQAMTAASLQTVEDKITAITGASATATAGLLSSSGGSASADETAWWNTFSAASSATTNSAANDGLREAIEEVRDVLNDVRADQRTVGAQLATPLAKVATILDRVSRNGNGAALTVQVDGVVQTEAA